SYSILRVSRVSAAWRSVGQSDWLPMTMATGGESSMGPVPVRLPMSACIGKGERVQARHPPGSGDDVGQQQVLDFDDPVLQAELALLQPLDQHLVLHARTLQGVDGNVEIGMLLALASELEPESGLLFLGE